MISHLAIVEFPDSVGHDVIDDLVAKIRALPDVVPVRSISAGVATSPSGERLQKVALAATFDTAEQLAAYSAHPDHVVIGALVKELSSSVSGADFTT